VFVLGRVPTTRPRTVALPDTVETFDTDGYDAIMRQQVMVCPSDACEVATLLHSDVPVGLSPNG